MANINNKINYIEMHSNNLEKSKKFYGDVFNWTFEDYGDSYADIRDAGIEGGISYTEEKIVSGTMVILYHNQLEEIKNEVENAGGIIVREIFSFPGGRRFHFIEPGGNELAIWSDK